MCRVIDIANEFESMTQHKTRRRRQCHGCGQWVAPGEAYWQFSSKCDGEFYSFSFCRWCKKRSEFLSKECNGFLLDEIKEDFEEHFKTPEESVLWILKQWGEIA